MKKLIDQILEILKNIIKLIFFITVATLIGLLFRKWGFPDTTIILIYGLAVLIEAVFADGYFYGILCTLIIIIVYNFFFTTPTFSFQVSDPSYFVSMLILSIYSGIVSFLTYRAKFNAKKALEKESETRALFMLVSKLSVSDSIEDIIRNSSNIFSEIFSTKVEVESFKDSEEYKEFIDKNPQPYKSYYEDANNEVWIIYGKKQVVGTVKFPLRFSETLPLSKLRLLSTMIEQVILNLIGNAI